MKQFTKKMWRCIVGVGTVVCLLLSMTVPAFAATMQQEQAAPEKTLKYVSLGDSMTNGYGLTNYDNNGYFTYGEEAYPNQFADWLVANGFADSVEHTQLAMSAMRAEDLHYILEFPVDNAEAIAVATSKWDEAAWNATFSVGDYYTWDEFTTGRFRQYNCTGVNNVAKQYQSAVADADIISVGTGNANFGVFLMGRLTNAVGFGGDASEDAWINVERALAECDETTRANILKLKEKIDTEFAKKIAEMNDPELAAIAAPIYNAVCYTAISYVLNYAGSIERILTLNPDAEVILVGIMNTMSGTDLLIEQDGETKVVPMADVLSYIVEPVNAYIAALPTMMQLIGDPTYADAKFYYAEAPEVECLVETYESVIYNKQSVVRDRFVEEIVGQNGDALVWSMVAPMFAEAGITLVPVTVADIEKHESNPYYFFMTGNINKMFSCAAYLGFENAILEAATDPVIPMESVTALSGDLSSVFAGVGAQLMSGNPAELANPTNLTQKLTDALTSDETVMGLLHLFARMMIGNGLGAHPSVNGHNELSAAVIGSYENNYTAAEKTLENLELFNEMLKAYAKTALESEWAQAYIQDLQNAVNEYAESLSMDVEKVGAAAVALSEQTKIMLESVWEQLYMSSTVEALTAYVQDVKLGIEQTIALGAYMKETLQSKCEQFYFEAVTVLKQYIAEAINGVENLEVMIGALPTYMENKWEETYLKATTDEVVLGKNIGYVVLGDDVAAGNSYADAYAALVKSDRGVNVPCINLATDGQQITDSFAIIEANAQAIAQAGLITIDYGKNESTYQAMSQIMKMVIGMEPDQYDWASLIGEDGAKLVVKVMAEMRAELLASGMDTPITSTVTAADCVVAALESYAYHTLKYTITLPSVVSAVRAVNPDAAIVVVGMYNPLKDAAIDLNGSTVEIGSYLDVVVDAVDAYGVALCMLSGDAIYVQAQDVQTAAIGKTLDVTQFMMQYMNNKALLAPTAEGDAYIAAQIDAALDEKVDVDNNGKMNILDVVALYNVVGGKGEFIEGQGAVADYDRNGTINMMDVAALYRVVSGADA